MAKPFSPEKKDEWKERILKQRESGLSIERWCKENNIVSHTFTYWKKKLFPKNDLTSSCFTELIDKNETGITIEYHGLHIHLDQKFDSLALKRCLEVLKEVKC